MTIFYVKDQATSDIEFGWSDSNDGLLTLRVDNNQVVGSESISSPIVASQKG